MIIENALIMNIGITVNRFEITKEMVLKSVDSFKNKPIVYNNLQQFKDYTEGNFENYSNLTTIGIITGNIVVTDTEVLADIIIKDEYAYLWKGKYDNWCIKYPVEDDESKFNLYSIEVF